jgi:hypothetical protein
MMGPNKAPGPDGLTAGFFQVHWDLIGSQVCEAVLSFLNGGDLSDDLNTTIIVLIPKCKNPVEMKQFQPISLCNVLYEICSKVLANHLRVFLDEIISEEQSAFVPGRLITDNVLIAYECTHYLKRKKGKIGVCAVKLDMAKAYDRVEWGYLEGIMTKLGFHEEFISRIMRCVTSVSSVLELMGCSHNVSDRLEVFDRETQYHLICSCSARRVYHVFFGRLVQGICPREFAWAFTPPGYRICFSRMIVLSLQKLCKGEPIV